jgi:C1A family cysteine protease
VNQFTDLTAAEFKAMYTHPKPYELKEADVEVKDFAGITAPSQVDWRTKGKVTAVKSQGACGACWAFSATGGIESAWAIAGHTLVMLSEQHLIDCSDAYGNPGCGGGYYRYAYNYVIANGGIATAGSYPYKGKDGVCNYAVSTPVSIKSKVNVAANDPSALENAVALKPTSVSVQAGTGAWQSYKSGTISSNCGTNLDHDVLAVGYDTTASLPFWIVKNSWGASWGMNGYVQIAITSGAGVCGINMTPGYPVV